MQRRLLLLLLNGRIWRRHHVRHALFSDERRIGGFRSVDVRFDLGIGHAVDLRFGDLTNASSNCGDQRRDGQRDADGGLRARRYERQNCSQNAGCSFGPFTDCVRAAAESLYKLLCRRETQREFVRLGKKENRSL